MLPRYPDARDGFTLIETLAALAIFSMIIVSTTYLLRDGVVFFDRGTRSVDRTEQFSLAAASLSRDFASARFILEKDGSRMKVAFSAEPQSGEANGGIRFITGGSHAAGRGDEIVELRVETDGGREELVRRRLTWGGPRVTLASAAVADPVTLLKGRFDITFRFSELTPNGQVSWHDDWVDKRVLPHAVRMILQAGNAPATTFDFPIFANAPAACGSTKSENCDRTIGKPGSPSSTIAAQTPGSP
jgi:type II secretion system protein J